MPLTIENLQTASFKGIDFACNDTTTTAGRSWVEHNFANSDIKNMEDQGRNPRIYHLTAIILGDNYEINRNQLLEAIESPDPGTLIHPFYGRIENAVALPVTYDETTKRLGRIEIPITFQISDSTGIPSATQLSASGITNRKDTLITSTSEDFGETFEVDTGFTGNFEDSQSQGLDLIDAIRAFVTITTTSSPNAARYFADLSVFETNLNDLIFEPGAYGEGITGLLDGISDLYETPQQTYDVSRQFFDFGGNDVPITPTTAGLTQRQTNRTSFNEAVQSSALGVAYEAASQIEFRTVDDVDVVSRQLEGEYRNLRF